MAFLPILATDLEMLSYHFLIEVHPDDGYEFCCLLTHVCSLYFLEGECPIWWVLFWWHPILVNLIYVNQVIIKYGNSIQLEKVNVLTSILQGSTFVDAATEEDLKIGFKYGFESVVEHI